MKFLNSVSKLFSPFFHEKELMKECSSDKNKIDEVKPEPETEFNNNYSVKFVNNEKLKLAFKDSIRKILESAKAGDEKSCACLSDHFHTLALSVFVCRNSIFPTSAIQKRNIPKGARIDDMLLFKMTNGSFCYTSGLFFDYFDLYVDLMFPYDGSKESTEEMMAEVANKIKESDEEYNLEKNIEDILIMAESMSELIDGIEKYMPVLQRKRKALRYVDDYGFFDNTEWDREKNKFLSKIPLRRFWLHHSLEDGSIIIDMQLDKFEAKDSVDDFLDVKFSDEMSPYEYEYFCSGILSSQGWESKVTKGSGDQGVDIIARKNGTSIAVQCKKFNQPVGNFAVQEVFSGSAYYDVDHSIVVTNNTYTPSARRLASKLNVFLINHEDLINIDAILYK